jgi:hypothetical protein
VKIIHRAPPDRAEDCGVTFAAAMDVSLFTGNREERRLQPLCTIPQRELDEYFPQIAEHLIEDSYFSINSYYVPRYRDGTARPSHHPDLGHLPFPEQGKRKLRQINACFADLDTYNGGGLESEYALAAVQTLARKGEVPQPSIFLDSGRGLWPIWLLHDNRDSRYSPPAFESLVNLSERVNRELTSRLSALGADRQAVDAARFLRVAGSRNTKSKNQERRVGYFIPLDHKGNAYTYSLDELVEFLQLKRPQRSLAPKEMLDSDTRLARRGQSGSIGRWARELQRFEMLRELRSTNPFAFPKGQRGRALRFYAGLLVRVRTDACKRPEVMKPEQRAFAQMTDDQLRAEVRALVAECQHDPEDPITKSDADSAVRSAINGGGIGGEFCAKAQTIADWFNITPEEARRLPESNRQPFPSASSFAAQAPIKRSRADESKVRRELLRISLSRLGSTPTLRELRVNLKAVGVDCTERTLMKDLAALGIENPRGRKAKRAAHQRKLDEAAPLFSGQGSEPRSEPFRTVPNLNNPTP